ncbi:OLC1v1011774C1 [Oldenlandia corymbosa var. corymbosa]|uniref:OLC1v1011774C1 n=1 Tax=Oldenlandia corymbosa var. corymbosa TaxID=529605 RepID=A0AAV1DUZ7_OLDCO|nr:OLC1v1011774C1 [Oldenlandia corymbosa var. corymbosa]
MPSTYLPLRWESTGDQWWYASPIDWAAANGHFDLVRELLRLDGNHLITLTSLRRIRRLETVWDDEKQFDDVAKCRSNVAKKLLVECENKKGKNTLLGAGYGGWLLYTAASAGDLGFVQELLERDPLLVFGEGEYGVTDVLYAAARSKNCEVFRVIFDFAVSPRFPSSSNNGGRELEEHIEDINIPAAYKFEMLNRAVHAASRGGNLKILKELIRQDCRGVLSYRDIQGATILHAAAGRGQVEVVKDLIASYDVINSVDNNGNTALHTAASRGQLAVVEALILASPSLVCSRNHAGETFLHVAVTGFQTPGFRRLDRQIELMKQLMCGKVFEIEDIINTKDNNGRTALHLAIIGNIHSDLVELLMTARFINVNIRDVDGMTPLDILKQRPRSASSEILTKQLMSAGGILSCQDYTTRKAIASHLRMRSIGGSPGTSFRTSDTEIFLSTGIENVSDAGGSIGQSACSPENFPQPNVGVHSMSVRKEKKLRALDIAAQRLKRLLHWPKTKDRSTGRRKLSVAEAEHSLSPSEGPPIPLRERFSRPSSMPNNKRTLAVRSNLPSPSAKKKLASGLVHGVMQAIPTVGDVSRRSRSSSFSKSSLSSPSSLDKQKGLQLEKDITRASCSSQVVDNDGTIPNSVPRQESSINKKLMNQFFCFSSEAKKLPFSKPYEIYERAVL